MKTIKIILLITGAAIFVLLTSSCMEVKNQLEYPKSPSKEYKFGKNSEISIELPVPTLEDPYYLYSNYLRWEWIGSGFADYFSISRISIQNERNPSDHHIIRITLNCDNDGGFCLYRNLILIDVDTPIILTFITAISSTMKYDQKTINRFVAEDNDLFVKILKSVRIKSKDGKLFQIKADLNALNEKIQKIYSAPNRPWTSFNIPYTLQSVVGDSGSSIKSDSGSSI